MAFLLDLGMKRATLAMILFGLKASEKLNIRTNELVWL
jgi:hypothetical protein